tara:strand:+ start:70 stop:381 length:312 start_codon:yes stop_codon:yes gene_type:complete
MIFGSETTIERNLLWERYNQLLITLPALRKHQEYCEDGKAIEAGDKGHHFTSLKQEISQWSGPRNHENCSERVRGFCDKRIEEIKNELKRRGYEPEYPYEKLT